MLNKLAASFYDMAGIFKSPGVSLGKCMEEKKWVPAFLLMIIFILLYTYLTYPIQMERFSEHATLSGYISEEQVAQYFNTSIFSRLMVSVFSGLMLFLSVVFGAFFVYLFYGIGGTDGVYANYFSLVVNASLIDLLIPNFLNFISLLLNVNLNALSKPGILLFAPQPGSVVFFIFERLDFFILWYVIAIAAGIAVFAKISFKRSVLISILYYFFKTTIYVAFGYLWLQIFTKSASPV
jgi:hypothetical protein